MPDTPAALAETNDAPKTQPTSGFSQFGRKTVSSLLKAWEEVKSTARSVIGADVRPSLPKEDVDLLLKQMRQSYENRGGEITARAQTAELGRIYLGLNEAGRARFLKLLTTEFDVKHEAVEAAIEAFRSANTGAEKLAAEEALKQALVSPRSVILRQFTALPNGFKFLVDMRADLLKLAAKDGILKPLELDLKNILSSWFDIGLLDLVEIKWETAPAGLLEKLIAYEAVHEIRSWDDLKNRLDSDRRIYAFFHNKMPLEPLIFVQVAFVHGMAGSIQEVLDTETPPLDVSKADTAIFYSISNAQAGLAGISFGNFLIKRVVGEIMAQNPQIKNFATLSPVPGFRRWLDPQLEQGDASLFEPGETKELKKLPAIRDAETIPGGVLQLLNNGDWFRDKTTADALKPALMRLCAHYLIEEKGRKGRPLDPVANFHLFNGARLERMNWLGDISAKGLKQSAGLMVNYHYRLNHIDDNHEDFASEGKVVASRPVRGLL